MVIQRNKLIVVFGAGIPQTEITVSIDTRKSHTIVREDGTWNVSMLPLADGEHGAMVVCDGNTTLQISNIAIGEVWLACPVIRRSGKLCWDI